MKTEPPNRIPEGESIVLKNQGPPGAIVVCRKTADGQEVVLDVEKTCDYSGILIQQIFHSAHRPK